MSHTVDNTPAAAESVWLVLPAFNESENLSAVVSEIVECVQRYALPAQVLIVDDGSTDDSGRVLSALSATDPRVHFRQLRRNQGKAEALRVGFSAALDLGASVVVMMDADGQDNPEDLPRMIAELHSGADLVTGARLKRNDRWLKRVTSRLYNWVTRTLSGTRGSDFNSGYKAMTADVARELLPTLYGELHRYITVIAAWRGFRVTEIEVTHRRRLLGKSKYGIARFWRGFADLMTIRFLMTYERRPSHLFAGVGLLTSLAGTVILAYLLALKIAGETIGDRPLLLAGILLFLAGLQLVLFGFIAELIVYGRHRDRA